MVEFVFVVGFFFLTPPTLSPLSLPVTLRVITWQRDLTRYGSAMLSRDADLVSHTPSRHRPFSHHQSLIPRVRAVFEGKKSNPGKKSLRAFTKYFRDIKVSSGGCCFSL